MRNVIVGNKEDFLLACERVIRAPLELTAFDFEVLDSTHPEVAADGRCARAKALSAAARVSPREESIPRAGSVRTAAAEPVEWDQYIAARQDQPVAFKYLGAAVDGVFAVMKDIKARSDATITSLEARVAELEAQPPGVAYKGI
jgi:hypothetical protein